MQSHSPSRPSGSQARLTLTLRKSAQPSQAADSAPKRVAPRQPASVPLEAAEAFCNWKLGGRRPSHRFASVEEALAERARLQALEPRATFFTYKLTLVES